MGYYVIGSGELLIKKENAEAAFEAVKALNAQHDLKSGGSSLIQNRPEDSKSLGLPHKWFSWMEWDYDVICQSLDEVFTELGFRAHTELDGSVVIGDFTEEKAGQEDLFLEVIAPFITYGEKGVARYFWTGEDGDRWHNVFKNGGMVVVQE